MVRQVKPEAGFEGPAIPSSSVGISFAAGALLVSGVDLVALSLDLAGEGQADTSLLSYSLLFAIALPSAVGASAYLIAALRRRLRIESRSGRFALRVMDLVPAVPFAVLVPGLLDGPAISQSPWRIPLMCGLFLTVAAGAVFARVVISRGAAALRRIGRPGLAGSMILIASVGGVIGLRELSRRILPGLYVELHAGFALAAVGVVSAGLILFLTARSSRPLPGRAPLAMAVVALIALPLGSWLSQEAFLARQLLLERAPLLSPLVGAAFDASASLATMVSAGGDDGDRSGGHPPYSGVAFEGEIRRSVVLITVDALRGDVIEEGGRFSGSAAGLRGISRRTLRFERAYSPGNYTPVSIPAMVLGYFPAKGEEPSPREVISAPFNAAGYVTEFHFTAHEYASLERTDLWPLASKGFFFRRYSPWYHSATQVLGEVEGSLEKSGGPVFVWAHLSDVHSPFLLRDDPGGAAGGFEASYAGQLAYLDSVLAPFLRRLLEERPDVIWALSSDHGESLGDHGLLFHGSSLYEDQVAVPLLLYGPGVEPGVVRDPVSIIDLGTTLLALAGAEVGDAPVLPTRPGEAPTRSRVLLAGRTRCGLVEGQLKLIVDLATGSIGLYDLRADPEEKRNLVDEKRDTARRMLDVLRDSGCPNSLEGIAL